MADRRIASAKSRLSAPANILLIFSLIWLLLLGLSLVWDVAQFARGPHARQPQAPNGMTREQVLTFRMAWGGAAFLANLATAMGTFGMKQLRGRSLSIFGCFLACIPGLGPCFLVGIPFGIWGLLVLNDKNVRIAYERVSAGKRDEYDDEDEFDDDDDDDDDDERVRRSRG